MTQHSPQSERRNDLATAASMGAVAYLTADVAHHAFGHGAACLALGGEVRSLSAVFVNCSVTGADVDLSGPAANLLVGTIAALLAMLFARRAQLTGFFLLLTAAFNLYWLSLQLVVSVATGSDDWAWPLYVAQVGSAGRWVLAIAGAAGYLLTTRFVGKRLGIRDRREAWRVVLAAWLAAGAVACLTAMLATSPLSMIAKALPQSLGLAVGLLFTPSLSARRTEGPQLAIRRSWAWIVVAIVCSIVSVLILGPGLRVAIRA